MHVYRTCMLGKVMPYADPEVNRQKGRVYSQKYRETHKASAPPGVCSVYPSCRNPAPEGFKKCLPCREYMQRYKEKYRARPKPEGQCSNYPDCANAAVEEGSLCVGCRTRVSVYGKAHRPMGIKRRRRVKQEVLAAYGVENTAMCVCCGEEELWFLSIDHINGAKDPTSPKDGVPLYSWLRRQGYPPGYRTLCLNCNFSLGHHGYCPHGGGLEHTGQIGRPAQTPQSFEKRERRRAYWQEYRLKVLNAYGGPKCACCGTEYREFLSIDHIGGTGAAHRKELTGSSTDGRNFLVWLKVNNFPPGFRVLCMNCNHGSAHTPDKKCPHEHERALLVPSFVA